MKTVPSVVDSTNVVVSTLELGTIVPVDPVVDTVSVDSVVFSTDVAVATKCLSN